MTLALFNLPTEYFTSVGKADYAHRHAHLNGQNEPTTQGIWLGTNDGNSRAVRLYERHGFARVGGKTIQFGRGIENNLVLERADGRTP